MQKQSPLIILVITLLLVGSACGSATPEPTGAPEPTDTRASTDTTQPTNTVEPTEMPSPTYAPEPTDTPEPTSTPEPVLSTEELKERWRVPFRAAVLTVGAYESLLETAKSGEEGEIDDASFFGELIGPGILLKATADALSEWEPAADQTRYKEPMQDYVSTAQEVIGEWSEEEITYTDVPGLLEDDYAAVQDTLRSIRDDLRSGGLGDEDIEAMLDELMASLEATTETPTPEGSLPASEAFDFGGLGVSRTQWEQEHTETGSEFGMTEYDNGAYLVMFADGSIQYLEPVIDELSLEEARGVAESLIPEDGQFVETYAPEGMEFLTVDLYQSEALKGRFTPEWFIGGGPGSFTVVYGDDDEDGLIERVVIATGNNP